MKKEMKTKSLPLSFWFKSFFYSSVADPRFSIPNPINFTLQYFSIFIPRNFSRIRINPGVQKSPDPGSGSLTLFHSTYIFHFVKLGPYWRKGKEHSLCYWSGNQAVLHQGAGAHRLRRDCAGLWTRGQNVGHLP
jgi:hypothetical protein